MGRPVIDFMGGMVREGLKAYASFPPYRDEKILIHEVNRAVNLGFAGIKLHEVDLGLVEAVCKAVPEKYPVMLDVNGHWNPIETEEKAHYLEDLNIFWMEIPLLPEEYSFPSNYPSLEMINGQVKLPQGPGLGPPEDK